jgi:hypothetical protein
VTTVEDHLRRRFGLGAIDQISFAVSSVDDARPRYEAMFGGPFTVVDVPDFEVVCRGTPSSTSLRLGFGRTGDLEVELVEVVSGAWPTVAWLAQHGEGLHHLRYPVADVVATRAEMEAAGCTAILRDAGDAVFSYLEVPMLNGMVVELISHGVA